LPLLIWFSLFVLGAHAVFAGETERWFFLSDGSTVALHWLTDRMVVEAAESSVAEGELASALRSLSGIAPRRLRLLDREKRWFRADFDRSFSAAEWFGIAERLAADKRIATVQPVFVHPPGGEEAVLTDALLVGPAEGIPPAAIVARARRLGWRLTESGRIGGGIIRYRIRDPRPFAALELANALFRSGDVRWAEPDFIVEIRRSHFPNDPYFVQQWHLNNVGQAGGLPDADIDAPEAWDVTMGSPDIVIAIIDDGLDIDHPDLRANIYVNPRETPGNGLDDDRNGLVDDVNGWDFLSDDNDPRPDSSSDYHATPCAGMAAAAADNATGVAGVAPHCKILPCRIVGDHNPTVLQVARAIQYAAATADVISMSWTTVPNNTIESSLEYAASEGRGGLGCLLCAATGNDARDDWIGFPASSDCVVAVGASTIKDQRSGYSNYVSGGRGVFILAPSSEPGGLHAVYTTMVGGYYGWFSGTSAATPEVAGAAALVLSVAPGRSRRQVEQVLAAAADKIDGVAAAYDAAGYSSSHGYGRLNASRAVREVAPDLAVLQFDFQPEAVEPGGALHFWGTVRNLGRGTAGPCWLEFWLSRSSSFSTLDILACNSVRLPPIEPGGEFRLDSVAAALSYSVPAGFYRVGVVVDRLGEVVETDESNGFLYQSGRILKVGRGSTEVDLEVDGFDFAPAAVVPGNPISFSGRVVNRGVQMSRPVWVEFWVSADSGAAALDHFLCDSAEIGPLGPGESFDLSSLKRTAYGPAEGLPLGRYRVGVVVDRLDLQVETDKADNRIFRLDKWLTVGNVTAAGRWGLYR